MSNAAPEIVHQTPTDDPHDWQTPASLAANLGIAERTIRHRAATGALERLKTPDGRTYYRQPRPSPGQTPPPAPDPASLPALVREHLARLEHAHRELADLRAANASAEATTAATLERLKAEADRVSGLEIERQQLTDQLNTERQHLETQRARLETFAQLATAPWYAFRLRRRLRRQLTA